MSQRLAPSNAVAQSDFETRAAGAAMFLLRVTLLGTLGAFVVALGISTWRAFHG